MTRRRIPAQEEEDDQTSGCILWAFSCILFGSVLWNLIALFYF